MIAEMLPVGAQSLEPRRWRHVDRPPKMAARSRVLAQGAALAETVSLRFEAGTVLPEAHCASAQMFLPLSNPFCVRVEGRELLCDLNQMGWLAADSVTQDRVLTRGDLRFLIVTVPAELSEEIDFAPKRSQLKPASPAVQRLAHLLAGGDGDALWREETLLTLLRMAVGDPPRSEHAPGKPGRLVDAVKSLLAATDETLSLTAIAAAVGASPAYLTDQFRLYEGLPIARYQLRLRLARGLSRLPDAEDICALALDLGFSSHSHFSSAFRQVYGVRPSEHRAAVRPPLMTTRPARGCSRPRRR